MSPAVQSYRTAERRIPALHTCVGMSLRDVKRVVADAHAVAVRHDPGPESLARWRAWYNVYLHMLSQGSERCPHCYQWYPESPTC